MPKTMAKARAAGWTVALVALLLVAQAGADELLQSERVDRRLWAEMSDEAKAALMVVIALLCAVVLWTTRRR